MTDAGRSPAPDVDVDDLVVQCLDALERRDSRAYAALLERYPEHADLLRRRVDRVRDLGLVDDEAPHGAIGPYRVLEEIGRGGMGQVYLCLQSEPIKRRVAVKVIKLGMDTREVIRRFETERQMLARMEHPAIAKVYDAGSTAEGRPFFAMEFVPGEPITTWCDRARLDTEGRLELFVDVCEAVQHAHQKGVIHRDIKPTNVLVALEGDRPRPRIIDFGVAKAAHGDPDTGTAWTEQGRIVGTPEYMSPEQASSGVFDIDTRSDVYSLGVLLHELLTGTLPHDSERVRRASPSELERILSDETPVAPSTRVRRVDAEETAWARSSDRRTLARRLRGDLDWIVLRALEPDRTRRYATALQLASDVRRHLAHEPVTAGPPGHLYAVRKFVRRHRAVVLAASIAVVALVTGTVLATLAMLHETRARVALQASQERFDLLATIEQLRTAVSLSRELVPTAPSYRADLEAWLRERGEPLRDRLPAVEAALVEFGAERGAGDGREAALAAFMHDTLGQLAAALRTFTNPDGGLLARMEEQLAWARAVEELTVEAHAEAWRETCEAIARDPAYRALRLQPQVGLVPVGRDPDSGLFEFAHLRSGAIPARDAETGRLAIDGESALVLVLLPPGEFVMGAQSDAPDGPNYDPRALDAEAPPHRIELGAFFLSKYEMTKGQWKRLDRGRDPSTFPAGSRAGLTDAHPVESVSWEDALQLLGAAGLDLPTEAQWEYATRAGTDTVWWTGDGPEDLLGAANLADASFFAQPVDPAIGPHTTRPFGAWAELDDGWPVYAPVDALRPNPFGLHQVHGNVWEWVRDVYQPYTLPVALDGLRQVGTSENDRRVYRGGSYVLAPVASRAAMRFPHSPDRRDSSIGVRPMRPIR